MKAARDFLNPLIIASRFRSFRGVHPLSNRRRSGSLPAGTPALIPCAPSGPCRMYGDPLLPGDLKKTISAIGSENRYGIENCQDHKGVNTGGFSARLRATAISRVVVSISGFAPGSIASTRTAESRCAAHEKPNAPLRERSVAASITSRGSSRWRIREMLGLFILTSGQIRI